MLNCPRVIANKLVPFPIVPIHSEAQLKLSATRLRRVATLAVARTGFVIVFTPCLNRRPAFPWQLLMKLQRNRHPPKGAGRFQSPPCAVNKGGDESGRLNQPLTFSSSWFSKNHGFLANFFTTIWRSFSRLVANCIASSVVKAFIVSTISQDPSDSAL